jgi:hypothetical protein
LLIAAFLLITFNAVRGEKLLIPLNFDKNAVQFVFRRVSDTNYAPMGTGFMVTVADTHKPLFFLRIPLPGLVFFTYKSKIIQSTGYFVTARHVLFDDNGHLFPNVYLRLTKTDGGVFYSPLTDGITSGEGRIITPDDKAVDLAVLRVAKAESVEEIQRRRVGMTVKPRLGAFDASIIANPEELKTHNIREGEEMFFVGLFTPFFGANENIPICRFGHLSMLTDEPIRFADGKAEHLYLMETETFGGNSGSPVFFSLNQGYFARRASEGKSGQPFFSSHEHTRILLAGVMKGYFPNWSPVTLMNTAVAPFSQQNTGIAVITPATYLYDLLFSSEELEFRHRIWELSRPKGYQ